MLCSLEVAPVHRRTHTPPKGDAHLLRGADAAARGEQETGLWSFSDVSGNPALNTHFLFPIGKSPFPLLCQVTRSRWWAEYALLLLPTLVSAAFCFLSWEKATAYLINEFCPLCDLQVLYSLPSLGARVDCSRSALPNWPAVRRGVTEV